MRSVPVSLLVVALAACPEINTRPPEVDAGVDDGPIEPCGAFEIPAEKIVAGDPWPGLRCSDFPSLCDLDVVSTVNEPDTAKAIDVVFVGDGFTPGLKSEWVQLVDALTRALTEPSDGFVTRRPKLFNFHRVDVASKTARVGNADRSDSALAGCVDIANTGNLVMDERLAGLAALANVKADVDVIVAVLRTNAGSPNASAGPIAEHPVFVRLNPLVSPSIVNHELGHALFHLGDEYGGEAACFTPPNLATYGTADHLFDLPNVSMEETGKKWAAIHSGAKAGGLGYQYCVYAPGLPCLMNEGTLPFCPVCSKAIDATLDAREGKNDGAPVCGIELAALLPTFVHGTFEVRALVFDRNPPTHWSLKIDGTEIGQGDVATWYARLPRSYDSKKLANGMHAITVDCRDRLGTTASARLDVKFQN